MDSLGRSPGGRRRRGRAWPLLVFALVLGACATSVPPTSRPNTTDGVPSPTATTGESATTWAPTTAASTLPTTSTTSPAPSTSTTAAALPAWWRPVTHDEPLRVWVVGDSLAGPLGSALAQRAAASGLAVVLVEYEGGTGLARNDLMDWPSRATERLPEVGAEVVVCFIGANDGQAIRREGDWMDFGTPAWDREYLARVGGFMDLLAGSSARVYWVLVPVMASAEYDGQVQHVNSVQRAAAASRPAVALVDAYRLFQDETGSYSARLPDEEGELVVMRLPDGVHLTEEGADYLAGKVLAAVAADWRLPALVGG